MRGKRAKSIRRYCRMLFANSGRSPTEEEFKWMYRQMKNDYTRGGR